ncbi:hypothetical protein EV421DRAFT_1937097 [Armillaria borealis]|uniref:F-box domain-containing protein n=1 Tax=Armillaria borealis TaxID=47425 RepID=A0AA39ITC7_9AGAR|nr:hypothetical protein EV421DRAFT_1937097 [Armillaria borealis]
MSSESNLATFEQHLRSDLENLPLELFEEIVSYLNIPTIKMLSCASSIIRKACIPLFFRSLSLPELAQGQAQMAERGSLHSPHSVEYQILKDFELSNLTFQSVEDYFWLFASLPSTLKKLTVLGNIFRDSQSTCHAVGRGIELEHLETKSAEDLSLLLRDDCPISLKSLRVASVTLSRSHDLEDLVQRTPRLVDLRIDIKRREDQPVSFPLTRLKSLSIIDRTEPLDTVIQLLSTPNIASPLEVVNLSMVIYGWLSRLPLLVAAFSHPQFCKLKEVKIMLLASYANIRISRAILNNYARKFERDLEAAGRSPGIHVTIEIDRRLETNHVPARTYNRPR